jgi:hypothetical protein
MQELVKTQRTVSEKRCRGECEKRVKKQGKDLEKDADEKEEKD